MDSLREYFGFWLLACVVVAALAWVAHTGMGAAVAYDTLDRLGDIDKLTKRVDMLETEVQLLSEFPVRDSED